MSEPEEKPGLLGRVKNAFFYEKPPAMETPPEESVSSADPASSTAPSVPLDVVDAAHAISAGASGFDATYAQIAGAGDPKTDQVLAAFADMSRQGLNGPPLVTAMTSLIRAFGADATAITGTVAERRQAIASAAESQRGAMQSRIAELGTRSAATIAAAEEEIKELQARIATLTEQVAHAKTTVMNAAASEQATFNAFERQATQKSDDLNAFAEFLAGATAKT